MSIIRSNCILFEESIKDGGFIKDFIDGKLHLHELARYGLGDYGQFYNNFGNVINDDKLYPILKDDIIIDFHTLKSKILDSMRNNDSYSISSKVLEMTENDFKGIITNPTSDFSFIFNMKTKKSFNLYNEIHVHLNNYITNIGLDTPHWVHQIGGYGKIHFYKKNISPIDYKGHIESINNSDKVVDGMIQSLYSSDVSSVYWKYLINKLEDELGKVDNETLDKVFKRNSGIGSIIDIDK